MAKGISPLGAAFFSGSRTGEASGAQLRRAGQYYVSYFDHTGQRVTKSVRTIDKAVALRIAAKIESEAALRRDGVVDAELDAITHQFKRRIEAQLTDYEAKLRAADGTDKHVVMTIGNTRVCCEFANFETAADISADGVNRYVLHMRNSVVRPLRFSHQGHQEFHQMAGRASQVAS